MKITIIFYRSLFTAMMISVLIFSVNAQITTVPKTATQSGLPANTKIKPVVASDTTKKTEYAATPVRATVSGRIATADELYLGNGSFLIRTARDYRYLTVKDDVPREQSLVYIFSYIDRPQQQLWKFIPGAGGFYKIQSESGLFLSQKRLLAPTTEPESTDDSQLWQLIETPDGYYTIKSKTNKYLNLIERRNKDGGVVSFSNTSANTSEQKWHLIKWTNDNRRTTAFIPATHGFRFINDFNGEDIIRWGGLCGGMVYTALDYFRQRIPIPRQSYMPANRTALQSYIYERQNHSMWDVNSSWTDLEVSYNTRGGELFRWGIEGTGSGRFKEVKDAVDAGTPKPLGLFAGGVRGKDDHDGSRHVVLIVGYAMGRYTGDPNVRSEEIKILVYNPNRSNIMTTLVPDRIKQCYFEVESGNAWRTYFVNNRYDGSHVPPRDIPNFPEGEAEGSVRHLYAQFITGNDDLRGENDNVTITVQYTDGTSQVFSNVNNGARWIDESSQTVHLELNRSVRRADIRSFMLTTSFGSDIFSDDWNLKNFYVSSGLGGTWYAWSEPAAGQPYIFRFSGDERKQRHVVRAISE
ncbi:MAG: RICIN domain-containing protein [Chitinophagaceae bacterium]|nr:RICIN domain-containing protein [Chitinophagaceae bacterium]